MNNKIEYEVIDSEEIEQINYDEEKEHYKNERMCYLVSCLSKEYGIEVELTNQKIEYLENQLKYRIMEVRSLAAILIVSCIVWGFNIL